MKIGGKYSNNKCLEINQEAALKKITGCTKSTDPKNFGCAFIQKAKQLGKPVGKKKTVQNLEEVGEEDSK